MSDGLTVTTAEAAALLGYRSAKSVHRLRAAGKLHPLAFPRCPLTFWRADVLALRSGSAPVSDRWR